MARKKTSPLDAEKKRAFQLFKKGELYRAALIYAKINEHFPKDFDTCLMLGIISKETKKPRSAINWFNHAINIKNNSARAFYLLGTVYRDTNKPEPAIQALRQATLIKPDHIEAFEALTSILQTEGLYHELVQACLAAITTIPGVAEFHARLAGAYEQTNQPAKAKAAAESALQRNANHTRALFTLAKIARREGNLGLAHDKLEKLLNMPLSPFQYSAVAGELGEVKDLTGEFDAAFRVFEQANLALRESIPAHILQHNPVIEKIRRYKKFFTEQSVSSWTNDEPDDEQDSPIFLVGFPRSGTTLTEQILASTGKIQPSDEQMIILQLIDELPALLERPMQCPEDLPYISQAELELLRMRYWELAEKMCGKINKGKHFLDKLPLNIIDLGFIYRIFPRAIIITLIRDPRDCCLSGFMRQFVMNEAMANLSSIEQAGQFYAEVMGLWLHYRENLPIKYKQLRYEDLIDDPEGASRALVEFAGLEWSKDVLRFYEKARERNVRTPSYSAIATPIYKRAAGRWKNYEKQIAPITGDLEPYIKEFGYNL